MASSSSPIPKYPYPSHVKVGDSVSIKLALDNYMIWRKLLFDFINSQGMIGFINGDIPEPPQMITDSTHDGTKEIENPDYQDWKISDMLVREWILSTLSPIVLMHVVRLKTAHQVWKDLARNLRTSKTFDPSPPETLVNRLEETNLSLHLPLYNASITGDWEKAKKFLQENPDAIRASITVSLETALMVAARSSKRIHFVKELIELMEPEDLALGDGSGFTALHVTALIDNITVAKMLVEKNPDLPNVWDKDGSLPIHRAAMGCKKEMVRYLLTVTKEDAEPKPFESEPGLQFVHLLIGNGMYDIALDLLQRYPKLALGDPSPMLAFTLNRSAFPSGTCYNFWQRLIYSSVPGKFEDYDQTSMNWAKIFIPGWRKLLRSVTEFAGNLVPQIRHIKRTKLLHDQVIHLVKWLCSEIVQLDSSKASSLFEKPLQLATLVGIPEVVEEIISSFSSIVRHKNELDHSVFHLAILNRRENIYNLIYQIEGLRQVLLSSPDTVKNNCLHLAGYLAPWPKLNIRESAAGAVLQLQRELQWFKEVENITLPQDKEVENSEKMTPAMLFVESHEELVKEGEQWMKDTANSCIIVATLIATIMFAAAITVPGGSNGDTGLANFSEREAFKFFAISDTLALFSSTTSMLMFLSILTSRYADEDFLYALPKRLIIGLVTLFLSIIFMIAAFGTIVYLVFGNDATWILEVIIGLGCLPVGLFVFLQFPLLWDMIKSTYFPSIFGKRSDRILL